MKFDINEAMKQLADGFGIAINELYPILHKQAMLSIAINALWLFLSIGVIIAFVLAVRKIRRKQELEPWNNYDWGEGTPFLVLVVGIPLSIGAVLVTMICIESIIGATFNPEYYMIEQVLDKLKSN